LRVGPGSLCIEISNCIRLNHLVHRHAQIIQVRPMVSHGLGLKGSMKEGPWSYRICSIIIMTPLYAGLLVVVGTLFGRHAYFRFFAVKMFSRFGIPPELMDPTFENAKKNFRKW